MARAKKHTPEQIVGLRHVSRCDAVYPPSRMCPYRYFIILHKWRKEPLTPELPTTTTI
jgi:hypothetical protein